jgi:arsenate reductase (glutaredoxin)
MAIHIYGIPNCGTVKKALNFLKTTGQDFTFHDFKKEGISREKLTSWAVSKDWELLLNKKGTTWRALSNLEQEKGLTLKGALCLMEQYPSIIKRPVVEWQNGEVTIGFDERLFREQLS